MAAPYVTDFEFRILHALAEKPDQTARQMVRTLAGDGAVGVPEVVSSMTDALQALVDRGVLFVFEGTYTLSMTALQYARFVRDYPGESS